MVIICNLSHTYIIKLKVIFYLNEKVENDHKKKKTTS